MSITIDEVFSEFEDPQQRDKGVSEHSQEEMAVASCSQSERELVDMIGRIEKRQLRLMAD